MGIIFSSLILELSFLEFIDQLQSRAFFYYLLKYKNLSTQIPKFHYKNIQNLINNIFQKFDLNLHPLIKKIYNPKYENDKYNIKINDYTLTYQNQAFEKQINLQLTESEKQYFYTITTCLCFLIFGKMLTYAQQQKRDLKFVIWLVIQLIFLLIGYSIKNIMLQTKNKVTILTQEVANKFLKALFFIITFIFSVFYQTLNMEYLFIVFVFALIQRKYAVLVFIFVICSIAYVSAELTYVKMDALTILRVYLNIIVGLNLLTNQYKKEYFIRSVFLENCYINDKQEQINEVLSILLPNFIKNEMEVGNTQINKKADNVGILFCDLQDMDQIIESENLKIVDILDQLFKQFDYFCQQYGVQKIETVGKTYMAAAGLQDAKDASMFYYKNLNPVSKLLKVSFEIMKYASQQRWGQGNPINLKLGIHYGSVIVGVIGAHKPQFSLIGDTINTTSRVCSTSDKNIITISQPAFERIQSNQYDYFQKPVEAKGKGTLMTYQIFKKNTKAKQLQLVQQDKKNRLKNFQKINSLSITKKYLTQFETNQGVQDNLPPTPLFLQKKVLQSEKMMQLDATHKINQDHQMILEKQFLENCINRKQINIEQDTEFEVNVEDNLEQANIENALKDNF